MPPMSFYDVDVLSVRFILFYIQYQAFEVFTLGVVDAYRVVGRLGELVQYAYIPLCHCCGCENCCAEIFFAYDLRAGEGEEYSAGLYLLDSLCVETAVAYEGVAQ